MFTVDLQEEFKEAEEIVGGLVQFATGGKGVALIQRFFKILKCILHKGEYGRAKN
ncbi:MAG: hypothetical protein HY696_00920 [Deltaproteobacteria bacterium]|nr:hypothetical protein [Deltaproteobacteria bacterium]